MARQPLPPEVLKEALKLQSKMWTHERIADELGFHRVTITRILNRHNARQYDKLATRHAAIRAKQASQLEHMADEAYQGWERSKLDAESTKVTSGGEGGERTEKTTKGQAGDTSFLGEARSLLADVRKVLEMDAAKGDNKAVDDEIAKAMQAIRTALASKAESAPES